MNITLSADEKVVERVREIARRKGTTLNDLIREKLNEIARQKDPEELAREFRAAFERSAARSPDGWTFNREEVYDRGNPR